MPHCSDLLAAVQCRAARIAVRASAVRGQPATTADAARDFLRELPLGRFTKPSFAEALEQTTVDLQKLLPSNSWGVARKLLNIFLRDATYTYLLRDAYHLAIVEDCLELPLDSIVIGRLRESATQDTLPNFPGVSNLTRDVSERYQEQAARVAELTGIARVHLDAYWWGQRTA